MILFEIFGNIRTDRQKVMWCVLAFLLHNCLFLRLDLDNKMTVWIYLASLRYVNQCKTGLPCLGQKWFRLTWNEKNLEIFKFRFQLGQNQNLFRSRLGKPKCTETDLKKSQICPILGSIWPNSEAKFDIPGGKCRDDVRLMVVKICGWILSWYTSTQPG